MIHKEITQCSLQRVSIRKSHYACVFPRVLHDCRDAVWPLKPPDNQSSGRKGGCVNQAVAETAHTHTSTSFLARSGTMYVSSVLGLAAKWAFPNMTNRSRFTHTLSWRDTDVIRDVKKHDRLFWCLTAEPGISRQAGDYCGDLLHFTADLGGFGCGHCSFGTLWGSPVGYASTAWSAELRAKGSSWSHLNTQCLEGPLYPTLFT